jgi:choline-sulfatase
MSVDDAVGSLVNALGSRMDDCLFIYTSDNGKMLGSHRLDKKDLPHKWSAEIPAFMRWDGVIDPGTTSSRVTPNVDLTATMAEAAGISEAVWPMDGRSYLSRNRLGTVVEQKDNPEQKHPAYVGYRTKNYLYVEYTKDDTAALGRELYDYVADPNELNNLAYLPEHAGLLDSMRKRTKRAVGKNVPPGFEWQD